MDIKTLHQLFLQSKSVSTDTRKIQKGSIFFALKGENFDANSLVTHTLLQEVIVVMDNKDFYIDHPNCILIENVLTTLQELAAFHRKYLNLPIIGLTGSNGKTTTKELINAVLSKKFKTVSTQGNFNNHIGVPLTLLSMDEHTEIGIVEMGANHFGEIALLSKIAAPNFGYITNFGKAHLEGFGSEEGVIKAKSELYEFLKNHHGIAFVNPSEIIQLRQTENIERIFIKKMEVFNDLSEYLSVVYDDHVINSNLVGIYNLNNIAAAVSIGMYFGVAMSDIKNAIETFKPDNKRSQLIDKGYCKIILDAYNANPTSMQAALENFSRHDISHKMVILGDMFEVGKYSEEEHQKIVEIVENFHFKKAILIGENFYKTKASGVFKYKSYDDFKEIFQKNDFEDNIILIKGSRGMALERVMELF